MVETTYKCKLVVSNTDGCGYTTMVFERENYPSPDEQYIMCVMFPNWQTERIIVGEIGFLTVRYIKAGEDTWFDGTQQVPYKYTDVHFMKFMHLKPQVECIEID